MIVCLIFFFLDCSLLLRWFYFLILRGILLDFMLIMMGKFLNFRWVVFDRFFVLIFEFKMVISFLMVLVFDKVEFFGRYFVESECRLSLWFFILVFSICVVSSVLNSLFFICNFVCFNNFNWGLVLWKIFLYVFLVSSLVNNFWLLFVKFVNFVYKDRLFDLIIWIVFILLVKGFVLVVVRFRIIVW